MKGIARFLTVASWLICVNALSQTNQEKPVETNACDVANNPEPAAFYLRTSSDLTACPGIHTSPLSLGELSGTIRPSTHFTLGAQ
jgi:hypothetical protein